MIVMNKNNVNNVIELENEILDFLFLVKKVQLSHSSLLSLQRYINRIKFIYPNIDDTIKSLIKSLSSINQALHKCLILDAMRPAKVDCGRCQQLSFDFE